MSDMEFRPNSNAFKERQKQAKSEDKRAEQLAHEAPTKLLFPLLLFIFPATIIVLLGPILANVLRDFA